MSSHLEHVPLYHMMFELAKEHRNRAWAARDSSGQLEWEEMKQAAGAIFFACASLESWANALVNDRSIQHADGSYKWGHGSVIAQRLKVLEAEVKTRYACGWEALPLKRKWLKLTEVIDPQGRAVFQESRLPYSDFADLVDIRNQPIAHHKAEVVADASTLPEARDLTVDWAAKACCIVVQMCDALGDYGGDHPSSDAWWHRSP